MDCGWAMPLSHNTIHLGYGRLSVLAPQVVYGFIAEVRALVAVLGRSVPNDIPGS